MHKSGAQKKKGKRKREEEAKRGPAFTVNLRKDHYRSPRQRSPGPLAPERLPREREKEKHHTTEGPPQEARGRGPSPSAPRGARGLLPPTGPGPDRDALHPVRRRA
ncbi:hypothetical protein D9C73_013328 [Collichthys lucidus]|uniref:Uncharacterized protein n=1 Tax=Collichthys lucidus TaxID=240159 RepID=A0A4U5UZ05_COLLU|nr:hypothetical protein D9C73_013328 [Collichthys lucidus]